MDAVYDTGSLLDELERECADAELLVLGGGSWPPTMTSSPTHSLESDDSGTGNYSQALLSVDPVISSISEDNVDENAVLKGNDNNNDEVTLVPRTRVSSRIAARPVVTMTSADKDHGYVLKLADNTTENQHQNKLPKAPKSVYSKIVEDPGVDKTTKTVIQARLNRQKKKEYIQGLESQVTKFKSENVELRQREKQWEKHRKSLEEEIVYLKSVLANDSRLSSLLKNINGLKNVHLSSAFAQKRKIDADHDYLKRDRVGSATGGVCLHVDSDEVSLEFCSRCSNQSKRSRSTVDER